MKGGAEGTDECLGVDGVAFHEKDVTSEKDVATRLR